MQELLALFSAQRPALICGAILIHLALCSSSRLRQVFSIPTSLASDLIDLFDRRYNQARTSRKARRKDSLSIALFLIIVGFITGLGTSALFSYLPYGWVGELILLAGFIGIRPLLESAHILARSLETGLEEARATLTLLTGRQSSNLNDSTICAAGVEMIATGSIQWFIAPLFWYALGGLPALFIFKLIDTASNMIDERSQQARDFGMAPRAVSTALLWPAAWIGIFIHFPGALMLPNVSFKAGISALFKRVRYVWPAFSGPVALFSGMLNVRLGGELCIGCFERTGDIFNPTADCAGIDDIHKAAKLSVLSILSLEVVLIILSISLSI